MQPFSRFLETVLFKMAKNKNLTVLGRQLNNRVTNHLRCFLTSETLERRFVMGREDVRIAKLLTSWLAAPQAIGWNTAFVATRVIQVRNVDSDRKVAKLHQTFNKTSCRRSSASVLFGTLEPMALFTAGR
jgi:hypothetical protein